MDELVVLARVTKSLPNPAALFAQLMLELSSQGATLQIDEDEAHWVLGLIIPDDDEIEEEEEPPPPPSRAERRRRERSTPFVDAEEVTRQITALQIAQENDPPFGGPIQRPDPGVKR